MKGKNEKNLRPSPARTARPSTSSSTSSSPLRIHRVELIILIRPRPHCLNPHAKRPTFSFARKTRLNTFLSCVSKHRPEELQHRFGVVCLVLCLVWRGDRGVHGGSA